MNIKNLITNMTNNKQFKVGDRVRTREGYEGIVSNDANKTDVYKVDFNDWGSSYYYFSKDLTLIDSTPNVSENDVKVYYDEGKVGGDYTAKMAIKDNVVQSIGTYQKGFNPDTLEFDGVKILVGDEVTVNGGDYNVCSRGSLSNDNLSIMYYDEYNLPLTMLNITAHYPAKDKELERLQGELLESENALFNSNHQDHAEYEQCVDSFKTNLHRYDQARKELEEYKSKNK